MGQEIITKYSVSIMVVLLLMVVFSPTRALLASVIRWAMGSGGPLMFLVGYAQSLGATLLKAHLLIFKNFAPRWAVLPTLDKTRR